MVLLDDAAQPRPGLLASLEIELADSADVEARHELAQGSTGQRMQAASALGQKLDAQLVVWSDDPITQPDGSSEAVLYVVGQRQGRALLQVVRVPGATGPEVDRTLAIKVHEVVDELARSERSATDGAALAPTPVIGAQPASPAFGLVVMLGAALGPQPRSSFGQWGLALRAGPNMTFGSVRGAATLGLRWAPSVSTKLAGAEVQLAELAPELLIGVQYRIASSLWLGAHAGLALSLVDATGKTARGRSQSQASETGGVLAGLDLELPITRALAAHLALDLRTRLERRAFTVNGVEITRVASVRPAAELGLAFRWP